LSIFKRRSGGWESFWANARLHGSSKETSGGQGKEDSLVSPRRDCQHRHTPYLARWIRTLVAKKYDSSRRRRVGRPLTKLEIIKLVVQMALDNETWGYTRIRDSVDNLGHEICRDTVANILKNHGIEPAPERGPRTTWSDFLKRHWDGLAATDFFTVEVWSLNGIVRYQVLFVIKIFTREIHIAGFTEQANGPWMEQTARNIPDGFDDFLKDCRHLIHDRDPLFTEAFRAILSNVGVKPLKLPRRYPTSMLTPSALFAQSSTSVWIA